MVKRLDAGVPAARVLCGDVDVTCAEGHDDEFFQACSDRLTDQGDLQTALLFFWPLLTHPTPPPAWIEVNQALERLRSDPSLAGAQVRELLRSAAKNLHKKHARVPETIRLSLALSELALSYDDRPECRWAAVEDWFDAAGVMGWPRDEATPELPTSELHQPTILTLRALCLSVDRHVERLTVRAVLQMAERNPFRGWSLADLQALLLGLRVGYSALRRCVTDSLNRSLADDWWDAGEPLYAKALKTARSLADQQGVPAASLGLDETQQQEIQGRLVLRLEGGQRRVGPVPNTVAGMRPGSSSAGPSDPTEGYGPAASDPLKRIVAREPFPTSSDRLDRDELERYAVLRKPLPLALMPSRAALEGIERQLVSEFPWGEDVVSTIFEDLIGRAAAGCAVLQLAPTMIVGTPGSGKSRFVQRCADLLGVPRIDIPLGGSGDLKQLSGTARGWSSGRPGDVVVAMATFQSASVLVLLDELDKACERHDSSIMSYLLALLEPQTAARHRDVFLKVNCDLSSILWMATGNAISPLPSALRSRLRILALRQPEPRHYPAIAAQVLADIATRWKVPAWSLPLLHELRLPWAQLGSARQVRLAVESAVARRAAETVVH